MQLLSKKVGVTQSAGKHVERWLWPETGAKCWQGGDVGCRLPRPSLQPSVRMGWLPAAGSLLRVPPQKDGQESGLEMKAGPQGVRAKTWGRQAEWAQGLPPPFRDKLCLW